MNRHPRRRLPVLAGLALLPLAVAGCAGAPRPASSPVPSASPAPVTARALAALVDEHLGAGLAAYDGGGGESVEGVVLYGAAPWATTRTVVLEYGSGPVWAVNESACSGAGTSTPPVQCESRDGVRVGRAPEQNMLWVASPRSDGVVTASIADERLAKDASEDEVQATLTTLIALAKDPRADATTVAGASMATPWNDDPDCAAATTPAPLQTPPERSAEPAQAPTPKAFVAMIAERVSGTCGWGQVGYPSKGNVVGTLYLDATGGERVTAAVTAKATPCKGMDACQKRGETTIAWQLDVPEEYSATVLVSRPIPGGYLVITHNSKHADARTKKFPVPLDTLLALAGDDRFGFTVDPALNRAGDELPLDWRLRASTSE